MRERLSWIRTTEELENLSPQWAALWSEDAHAIPFQSPEWLVPWCRCFGADVRSLCIHQDDALIGLLPFYVYREPHTNQRQLLPLGVGTSDYLDGVFSPRCKIDLIERAVEFLCSEHDWDALFVPQLRAGSRLLQALQGSARKGETRVFGKRIQGESCSRMPAVTIAELPQKLRRNTMYYRNRAQRTGRFEFALANTSNWSEIFDALVRLHTERWRDRGEAGVFADVRMVRWHRETLPSLERAGLLRLYSLRLNSEIIAAFYCLIDPPALCARTQYFYLPAYSIHHADLRPGTLLTAMAVEHAAREGVRTIDMLRGDEEYKKLWHTERTPTFGFVRYREALPGQKAGEMAA